jgi:hypothetical protein
MNGNQIGLSSAMENSCGRNRKILEQKKKKELRHKWRRADRNQRSLEQPILIICFNAD